MDLLKRTFLFTALLSAVILFFSAIGESQGSVVRIIFVKGNPKIMREAKGQWEDCKSDTLVNNGDRIKTLESEEVEISFLRNNDNILRIEENSDVFVRKSEGPYSIELLNGQTMALISSLPKGSAFEIRTPTGISGARGTGWGAGTNGASSLFSSFMNYIYVSGIDKNGKPTGKTIDLKGGWKTALAKFGLPSKPEKLTAAEMERWNKWLEALSNRLGKSFMQNLNRAGKLGSYAEQLDHRKQAMNEARDEARIESRLNKPTDSSSRKE